MNPIIESKKTLIKIDDYNSFHKMHRIRDFDEFAHYLSLYFFYHYVPYWRKNVKPKMDRLLGNDIKMLGIWDGDYGLSPKSLVQEGNLLKLEQESPEYFEQFDVIFNLLDSEIDPKSKMANLGLEKRIQSGEINLHPDAIYIGFKSSIVKTPPLDFYNLFLIQSFESNNQRYPVILESEDKSLKFNLPYGPWPLGHLDMENFLTPWQK